MELLLLFFLSWSNILMLKPTFHNEEQTSERKRALIFQKCSFRRLFFSSHHPIFLIIFYPFILGLFRSVSLLIFASSFFTLLLHLLSCPTLSLSEHHLFLAVAHEKPSSSPICIAMHFGEFLCLYFNNSWILIDAYQMCLKNVCAF